jgi:hypothetical protein
MGECRVHSDVTHILVLGRGKPVPGSRGANVQSTMVAHGHLMPLPNHIRPYATPIVSGSSRALMPRTRCSWFDALRPSSKENLEKPALCLDAAVHGDRCDAEKKESVA